MIGQTHHSTAAGKTDFLMVQGLEEVFPCPQWLIAGA